MSKLEYILNMIKEVEIFGGKPVTVIIKRKELEQPKEQIFGLDVVVKPDDVMPEGVEFMVVDKMSIYPPLGDSDD